MSGCDSIRVAPFEASPSMTEFPGAETTSNLPTVLDKLPAPARYSPCSAGDRYRRPAGANHRHGPESDGPVRATESTRVRAACPAERCPRRLETYGADLRAVGKKHHRRLRRYYQRDGTTCLMAHRGPIGAGLSFESSPRAP